MNSRLRLTIIIGAFFCLLPAVALGDSCIKTLYIDGTSRGAVSATNLLSQDDNRLTIGAAGNYLNRVEGLVGQIDEFAIYTGILSDPCISYHASFTQGDAGYVAAVQHDNPLLYFRFEDASSPNGAPVLDSGSVARNGTYIGDDIIGEPNLVAGYIGNAVELYGAVDGNGTCIDVDGGDGAFYPASGDVTIEFWAKVPDYNEVTQWYFEHSNGGTQTGYGANVLYFGGTNNYYTGLRGGGSTSPVVTFGTGGNQWHHIAVTFDSTETVQAPNYVDVVKQDDPCLYLRFENALDPCDDSNNGYWVKYGNSTTVGPEGGGIGNCIYFPGGADSYAAAANQQTEPPAAETNDVQFGHQYGFTPGSTTFEFWYRGQDIPELPVWATFFNQSYRGDEADIYNSPLYEMGGRIAEGGATYTRYPFNRTAAAGGWGYACQNPAMAIPLDDAWHHIVFSWDEMIGDANQMNLRLCIDGESVKTALYNDTSPVPGVVGGDRGEMDHIMIGCGGWRDGQAGERLVGYMDEFAIYGGVLPINRVIAHYEAGLPKNCTELWNRGLVAAQYPWAVDADRNQDCLLDFYDFAAFASEWALCNEPGGGTGCSRNW
jgi:hypothetical protein